MKKITIKRSKWISGAFVRDGAHCALGFAMKDAGFKPNEIYGDAINSAGGPKTMLTAGMEKLVCIDKDSKSAVPRLKWSPIAEAIMTANDAPISAPGENQAYKLTPSREAGLASLFAKADLELVFED